MKSMRDTVTKPKQTPGLNPFLPFSLYIPDGEPKVFGDRLYLYGSFDLPCGEESYCSDVYHAVSAPLSDLTRWTDHGVSFSSADVPWSRARLYAPDALYHNGKYYLYFCMADGTEGVAESDSPAGPFTDARQIMLNGKPVTGIDPSVLEYEGKIYYTWGQFHMCMGELNADLCTLKPETVRTDVLSNAPGREGFHEGSSLRRLGDKFCIIYASEYTEAYPNSGGRPTKLDYALSDAPYGPYTRRGTVIDNTGCDPASWNNHGSVVKAGDDWYVFYHASSGNTCVMRRARAERLMVDEKNAVIEQAAPTTNGFVKVLLPEHITSPANACRFFGGAYVTDTGDGRFPAVGLANGAGFAFSPIRFAAGAYLLRLRYSAAAPAQIALLLNGNETALAPLPAARDGEITIPFTADAGEFPLRIEMQSVPNAADAEIYGMAISARR